MFQGWLITRGLPRITVLTPFVKGSTTLYRHCRKNKLIPSWRNRWCTDKFKIRVLHKYYQKPAIEMLGIDVGEIKRARISSRDGFECRYPLVEYEIDRAGCEDIIRSHNLPIPQKSGCYICPYQKLGEWKRLRREQPDLFCIAEQLENESNKSRIERGKTKIYIGINHTGSLRATIDENQIQLFKEDEYPPCNCGL